MSILLVILILVLFAGAPQWGYHGWGYWPSGGIGLVLVVLLILVLLGYI